MLPTAVVLFLQLTIFLAHIYTSFSNNGAQSQHVSVVLSPAVFPTTIVEVAGGDSCYG